MEAGETKRMEARLELSVLAPDLKSSEHFTPTERRGSSQGCRGSLGSTASLQQGSSPSHPFRDGLKPTLVPLFPPFPRQLPLGRVGGARAGPQGAHLPRVHRQPL